MNYPKKIIFLFALSVFTFFHAANAQQIEVKATIDSTNILIGQQTLIKVEVLQPEETKVNFPNFQVGETITEGVEILAISKADTSNVDNGLKIRQDYLITSFDSGSYVIPPFKFQAFEQEYVTNSLFLDVHNIEIDDENAEIKDIKPVYEPPFNWLRFLGILLLVLLAIAIIGGGIYFYIQKRKNRPIPFFEKKEIKLPPHEVALQKLNKIKDEKIWQKGQEKLYYTQVTDTLREYFTERFNIPAMEMTSAEILSALNREEDAKIILDKLKQIFSVSDMVKFAKGQPFAEENEMSIVNAFFIVNQTTIEPVIPSEEEIESQKEEEKEEIEDRLKNT